MANFWRRFVFKFSDIARPLNDLLRRDQSFEWTPDCQIAFDTIKSKLASDLVLRAPDFEKPFYVETDSSGFILSGILMQKHDNNGNSRFHPIEFYSASLNPTER